jgi:hypothetical protein
MPLAAPSYAPCHKTQVAWYATSTLVKHAVGLFTHSPDVVTTSCLSLPCHTLPRYLSTCLPAIDYLGARRVQSTLAELSSRGVPD